jgi:AbrB family looped-hinge helix DNA binding protein
VNDSPGLNFVSGILFYVPRYSAIHHFCDRLVALFSRSIYLRPKLNLQINPAEKLDAGEETSYSIVRGGRTMKITILSSKGQIVIPKQVREMLGVKSGTRFRVEVEENRIVLVPVKGTIGSSLCGRFRDENLLGELVAEHKRELGIERRKDG